MPTTSTGTGIAKEMLGSQNTPLSFLHPEISFKSSHCEVYMK